jgi:rhodanese-related sulfurtransferase
LPQVITKGHRQLVEEANAIVEEIGVEAAQALYGRDDVQFVDVRDIRELEREGRIPGAFHCPRGMLEFWIDPESPYAKAQFQQDKHFVFFCAGGLRSALAARAAQEMGLKPVSHIRGGYGAWRAAGFPTEPLPPKAPKP